MLFFPINSSKGASEGTQGSSSDNKNLEPEADGVTAVLQGPGIARSSSTGFLPKLENIFRRKSNRNVATRNSQQSPIENEDPSESKTGEVTTLQGADGEKTFKPEDLSIESQSWIISEGDNGFAELLEVCWLDVTGSMIATKGKTYQISFKLSMNEEKACGWEDPVAVMAKIGEEGEYECVNVDLSQLRKEEKVFPPEKFRIECKSDEKNETKLYFGLHEVWTNRWKAGLRIHEAIVQEVTAEDSASTSNTRPDESDQVLEITADNPTSASNNPSGKSINQQGPAPPFESVIQKITAVPDSASTSNNRLDDIASASRKEHPEDEYFDAPEDWNMQNKRSPKSCK